MFTNQAQSITTAETNGLRDIKPPVEISSGLAWVFWTLGALALAALLFLAWRFWRKRKANDPVVPPIPVHVRAKQRLAEALALISQPKPFVIAVSDAARWYLEERFNFRAPERTTEEFLYELQSTNLLLPDQKESLGEFLKRCDLVKFARYEPREAELRDLHDSAVRLVDETEPEISIGKEQPSIESFSATQTETTSTQQTTASVPIPPTENRGQKLAIIGAVLQLGPSIWTIAYVVMLIRLVFLAKNAPQSVFSKGFEGVIEMYAKMFSIYGDMLFLIGFGLLAGIIGLVLLFVSLVSSKYRAEWFFWFLVIYGAVLLLAFPCFGTAIGLLPGLLSDETP